MVLQINKGTKKYKAYISAYISPTIHTQDHFFHSVVTFLPQHGALATQTYDLALIPFVGIKDLIISSENQLVVSHKVKLSSLYGSMSRILALILRLNHSKVHSRDTWLILPHNTSVS